MPSAPSYLLFLVGLPESSFEQLRLSVLSEDYPVEASDSALIADLIQAFVSGNWFPYLLLRLLSLVSVRDQLHARFGDCGHSVSSSSSVSV